MKTMKLAGWLVFAVATSHFMLHPVNIALAAKPQTQDMVQPVNINEASTQDFERVNGIGPALAERIVEFRQANGKFKAVEDLKAVKGIGDAKFDKMKHQLTLS